MRDVLAMILAGGKGKRMGVLAHERATSAVPFAGKYRIIDFPLSNCVNSGIYSVGILAQYLPRSLSDHIKTGKPWDLDRRDGGVRILQPYSKRTSTNWYRGTADALLQNIDRLERAREKYVLVLSGDHVYTMDYNPLLEFHIENNSDLTIGLKKVDENECRRFGMAKLAEGGKKVVGFKEKPKKCESHQASMGIYLFSKDVLLEQLKGIEKEEAYDIVFDVLLKMLNSHNVFGYQFNGYWDDIGRIKTYYDANMDLLSENPKLDLTQEHMVIHTRSEERPPVKFGQESNIHRSLISNGCMVDGEVLHSVLSPGVKIEAGAVVEDSVIMTDVVIKSGAIVKNAILDKRVIVGKHTTIGLGKDVPNSQNPFVCDGITIVGKGTRIPANLTIGKNCEIGVRLNETNFRATEIKSGERMV